MKITQSNRWLIIFGAIIVQISIGTIYSWSLFNFPLMDKFGWNENQVVLTFSIATFMFAFSTMLSGKLLDHFGPRVVTTLGGLLYGGGLLLASTSNTIIELYIYYGVLAGMGVGFVYVCPISTSVKWFPDKKGLITGIAVGAFGLGSLVFKFIIEFILENHSITNTFLILGIIYMSLIVFGAQFLMNPEKSVNDNKNQENNTKAIPTKQMLHTPLFYLYWSLFYLGTIGGLLVIGLAIDIGVRFVGLSITTAANTVILIAFFNASGRIIWGSLSDKIGRIQVVLFMFIITGVSMFALGSITLNFISFFIVLAAIAFCFGGFLAVFPIITAETFGKKYFGSNYGIMYQAYGVAALTGPLLLNTVNKLQLIFMFLASFAFIGLIISIYLLKYIQKNN